jgi:hypothetical protein
VLIALGGSPEGFDRANDRSTTEPLSLGSRVAAYSRLKTAGKARTSTAAEPAASEPWSPPIATPAQAEPKPELAPVLAPVVVVVREAAAVPAERSVRGPGGAAALGHVRRVVVEVALTAQVLTHRLIHVVIAVARLLMRAAGILMRSAVHAIRLFAPLLSRAARALALALVRTTVTLTRSLRPPRPGGDRRAAENVAAAVIARLRPRPPRRDRPGNLGWAEPETDGGGRESEVATVEAQSWAHRSGRSQRKPRTGLALLAAAVVIVPVALVLAVLHRSQGVVPAQRSVVTATAEAVASRTAFSNPRTYAGAMTRLALANGRTQLNGEPACDVNSTWERWTCRAKGRPALGPYAGRWLTYRCSPSYNPQPGGPPALMITCTPKNAPPLTT